MQMSDRQRMKALVDTREQAVALLEDIQHFRDILTRLDNPSRGELRRLSGILRRLLIDNAITAVAAPRIGRFSFTVPDNSWTSKSKPKLEFYFLGGAPVPWLPRNEESGPPPRTAKLRRDRFLSQIVLFYNGVWITRKNIIEYVAYVASGVHNPSGRRKTEIDATLDQLRRGSKLTKEGLVFTISLGTPAQTHNGQFLYGSDEIDVVLLQLFSDIFFIVNSDDTKRLEEIIRAELAIPPKE